VQEHYKEIGQQNAQILSISVKTPAIARLLVDRFHLEYPVLCDVDKQVIPQYGVLNTTGANVIPSVFIVDTQGVIRWKHVDDGTGIVYSDTIIEELQKIQ